jgi:ankyrin repeat protein
MNKPRGLFWIKGNPGSGKSVLMKFAVTEMHRRKSRELVTSFFIHGRGSLLQKTPLGVFRALLNSVLKFFPEYLSRLTERFEDQERRLGSYQDGRWEWDVNELRELMTEILTKGTKNKPLVIFIDALDECGEDYAKFLLVYFRGLMEEVEHEEGQVKICFSSRHYPILGHNTIPTISVETRNGRDIRSVIQEHLQDIDLEATRQQIWETILSKARGGFQWAVLVAAGVVDQYTKGTRVEKLHEKLTATPETLDELYSHILSDITGAEKHYMIKLFQWVLIAERPLSSQELREALATDKDMVYSTISQLRSDDCWNDSLSRFETYVKHISRGLVEFQTRELWDQYEPGGENWDREAQFIHQSVADYVLKKFLNHTRHDRYASQSPIGAGHFELSRSCLKYMMLREVLDGAGLPRGKLSAAFPLMPYIVRFLFRHIQRVEREGIPQPDLLLIIQRDRRSESLQKVETLWRVLDSDRAHAPIGWPFIGATPLHVLVAFGSKSAFDAFLQGADVEVDGKDSAGNTPLLLAIREGHYGIALALLDRSIDWQRRQEGGIDQSTTSSRNGQRTGHFVNVNTENNEGDTPLTTALTEKSSEVILKLIDAGADPKFFGTETALVVFAIRNKDEILFMKLIEKKVNLEGAIYFALQELSSVDDGDVLEKFLSELLQAGANISKTQEIDMNCEMHMEENDNYDHYEDTGVDENEADYGSESDDDAVLLASRRGQAAAVNLLLSHGASATSQNKHGRFPLLVAAENNQEEIVKILLKSTPPTAVEMKDSSGRTPLSTAAESGHEGIVQLLLKNGANLETKDRFSRTPLLLTAKSGHEAIAQLLLEKGANPETEDGFGHTPVSWAAENGHMAIIQLLLEKGASLETKNSLGQAPLSWATENGNEAIVRLLLEKGASLETENRSGQTPLSSAADSGHEAIAQLLLEKGASLETKDSFGRSPLLWAARNGREAIVRLLLEKGASPKTKSSAGQTPLFWAAENENRAIVRLLLEKGANLETMFSFGQTPEQFRWNRNAAITWLLRNA